MSSGYNSLNVAIPQPSTVSEPETPRRESRPAPNVTSNHVQLAIGGDLDALDRLVARLSPLLLVHARYRMGAVLRRQYDPEDVVHEAWLVTLPRLAGLEPRDGRHTPVLLRFLSTTIMLLVRNLARKHVLGTGIGSDGEADPVQQLPAEQSGIVTKAVRAEMSTEVHRQLERLGDVDRQIVILRGIEQQSNATAGLLLEMEPKTVSKRYHRALMRLRGLMPGSVFDEFDADDRADS